MLETVLTSFSFDWTLAITAFLRIGIAFVLALPIAYERAHAARSLGLRTFPLVAIASCGYMLIAKHLNDANAETMTRALQGLLSGIGLIGGGQS